MLWSECVGWSVTLSFATWPIPTIIYTLYEIICLSSVGSYFFQDLIDLLMTFFLLKYTQGLKVYNNPP